ncbi:MAG: single-stranded DNA-binding protein, partial [Planktothrix sp.]
NMIERKEGFKEKRAELTAQRIYPVQMELKTQSQPSDTATTPNKVVPLGSRRPSTPAPSSEEPLESRRPPASPAPSRVTPPSEPDNPDYDPIPF